jgi:hypothetical protein
MSITQCRGKEIMRELFLTEADLEDRRKNLAGRLKPYMPGAPFIGADFYPVGLYKKAIAIHGGRHKDLPYQNWRVSLSEQQVSVCYYEIWEYQKVKHRGICYVLNRAYLHLYLLHPSENEKDLIFLQCDPQEPEGTEHYRFKVAPHVHFEIAGHPWKIAHIPLCDGCQDKVLQSVDTLDEALKRGMEFIVNQIYPLTSNLGNKKKVL